MHFMDLEGDQLKLPKIDYEDMENALYKTRPSVSEEDQENHVKFTTDFGEDG